ncbi:MAG: hypothetical protein OXF05_08530 [Hyphomicrobiales bacterium]|nr:hypothetical protein [Hyphomicrobiales bacterium]MCY4033458.1 hypothetical protein [Hyphomicrobiales bacterium]MCY4038589.1 hypothetical protein [Hyphomicrobiales bacterium]
MRSHGIRQNDSITAAGMRGHALMSGGMQGDAAIRFAVQSGR